MAESDSQPALSEILHDVPLAIAVSRKDGAPVFVNRAAETSSIDAAAPRDMIADDRVLETRRFDVAVAGEDYAVDVTIDVTEQRDLENRLFSKAYFDDLTGLPNRGLLEQSVSELMHDESRPFALAFIDLDGFKRINDYYGHTTGDQLLCMIAARLSTNLRSGDMLARVGGDEFVMLISPVAGEGELEIDISWISQRLKEPFHAGGFEIFASGSIGVSLYPRDGTSFEVLRSNADSAMYKSKSASKGGVSFFDKTIEHAAVEQARVEQRLRLAIRDRRLRCAYQPKVDFRTGSVVGVEALLRWCDEDGLIQAPTGFIDLALELGLLDEITRMVLSETVKSIDRINQAFGAETSISLNVAAKQADDPRFMRSFLDMLKETGYADRFMLEVTEETFLPKSDFQKRILPMIRDAGVRISIDDFGTGYSSLSSLADTTADEIKVDRSFITDIHKRPRSQSILRAIEALGVSLGMSVIVEGVETYEELAYLMAATRINFAQGFYFGKAILLEKASVQLHLEADIRKLPDTRKQAANRS